MLLTELPLVLGVICPVFTNATLVRFVANPETIPEEIPWSAWENTPWFALKSFVLARGLLEVLNVVFFLPKAEWLRIDFGLDWGVWILCKLFVVLGGSIFWISLAWPKIPLVC